MTTPGDLGLDTPTGNDLIRDGDNNITKNATVLAQVYDQLRQEIEDSINALPELTDQDLDTFVAPFGATGRWRASAAQGITGYPPQLTGGAALFESYRNSSTSGFQRWTTATGTVYERSQTAGDWSPWTIKGEWQQPVVPASTDLDTLLTAGAHRVTASQPVINAPWPGDVSYTLEVMRVGTSWTLQRATNQGGQMRVRVGVGSSGANFGPWNDIGAGGGGGDGDGIARTAVETSGYWTTHTGEDAFFEALGAHQNVTRFVVGQSVENRPIYGVKIGNPANPVVLMIGTQHGDEIGPREGLMMYARELAQAESLVLLDLCIIIIPTLNTDRLDTQRTNANGINLNRDWEAAPAGRTQPEVQAVVDTVLTPHNVIAVLDCHNFGYMREVSMRPSGFGATPVRERAQRLFDDVTAAYGEIGQACRLYGEPEDEPTVGTIVNELARTARIPGLLLEVPYHRNVADKYTPTPYWHAYVTAVAARKIVDTIWRERTAYLASKANQAFTPPARQLTLTERVDAITPRDTGWRNVSADVPGLTGGVLFVRRVGSHVFVTLDAVTFSDSENITAASAIPLGFRPDLNAFISVNGATRATAFGGGTLSIVGYTSALRGSATWITPNPWPTTLPGNPA